MTANAVADNVLTLKQQKIFHILGNLKWKVCVNHGAVRSGKTYLNNLLFLDELRRVRNTADKLGDKKPMYILAGVTATSIENNVLAELTKMFGFKITRDKTGAFELFGVRVVQATTEKSNSAARIQGMTAYGAYINEGALAHKTAFDQIVSRCSQTGSRILVDANPQHPEHWLKTEYIDKSAKDGFINFRFELDDNPHLAEDTVNMYKTAYSGVFYERNILGKWVTAEGAIYSMYDKKQMSFDVFDMNNYSYFFAGVDWGYGDGHAGAITVIGVRKLDDGTASYDVVYEVVKERRTIDWWVHQANLIRERFGKGVIFYCDSARPDNIQSFRDGGISAREAKKAIDPGIQAVAMLFQNNRLKLHLPSVPELNRELYLYSWGKNGKPRGENDHACDALRYAIYTEHYERTGQPTMSTIGTAYNYF